MANNKKYSFSRCDNRYRCESCKKAKNCTDPAKNYASGAVRAGAKKLLSKKYGALVLVLLVIVGGALYFFMNRKAGISPDADAEFHFIDVGQGDAAMVITSEAVVVIDCGPVSSSDVLTEYIKRYTDKIDCLVISHPHEDHMGGAASLINEFEIGEIIMEGYDEFEDAPAFYERAYDAMVEKELYPVLAVPGESHTYGDISMKILSPSKDFNDPNNNSIMLRLEVDGAAAIFTGDAETPAENVVLGDYYSDLDADILKVGHHGSSTSTSEEFYLAVTPDIAMISCAADNSYGHPHRETKELFKKHSQEYYRTDEVGSIVLVCKDGEVVKK